MKLTGMRILPRAAVLAACAAAAVAATACSGTPASTGSAAPTASSATAQPAPTPTPAPPALSVPQLKQRAAADAASILASFVPPPGARRLAKAPAVAHGLLTRPAFSIGSFDQVDDVSWWEATDQPQYVLAWELGQIPSRFQVGGPTTLVPGPTLAWYDTYWLSPVTGVLVWRDMVIETVGAGGGRTAIRVDAQVTWQPPRPASERVPAAARVVTIAEVPASKSATGLPKPETITNPAVVSRLAAATDGLELLPPGKYACPPPTGNALMLTFRAQAAGPALAVANSIGGCESVTFTVDGRSQPALAGAESFNTQVLSLAGLRWQL